MCLLEKMEFGSQFLAAALHVFADPFQTLFHDRKVGKYHFRFNGLKIPQRLGLPQSGRVKEPHAMHQCIQRAHVRQDLVSDGLSPGPFAGKPSNIEIFDVYGGCLLGVKMLGKESLFSGP